MNTSCIDIFNNYSSDVRNNFPTYNAEIPMTKKNKINKISYFLFSPTYISYSYLFSSVPKCRYGMESVFIKTEKLRIMKKTIIHQIIQGNRNIKLSSICMQSYSSRLLIAQRTTFTTPRIPTKIQRK